MTNLAQKTLVAAATAACTLVGSVGAQGSYGSAPRSFGSSWAGAKLNTNAGLGRGVNAEFNYKFARGYFLVDGTGSFLKHSFRLGRVSLSLSDSIFYPSNARYCSAKYTVDVAGKRVVSRSITSGRMDIKRRQYLYKAFPRDPSISYGWFVFSVRLSGNVGTTAAGSAFALMRNDHGFISVGTGTVSAFGYARLSFNFLIGSVGLEARIDLAQQNVNWVGSSSPYRITGWADYEFRAFVLKLLLHWSFLFWDGTKDLAHWSSATYRKRLVNL